MTEISPDGQRLIAVLATRACREHSRTAHREQSRTAQGELSRKAPAAESLAEADWERLLALALQHGVAPVVCARLKELDVSPLPAVEEALSHAYVESAARNMRLFHEFGKILRAFRAASIEAIPLKGACLAEAVYGDIALRPMSDIDLWVQRKQLDAARAVVQSLGYAIHSYAERPLALQDELMGETQMLREDAPPVELHWNVFPGEWLRHTTRIDEDVVWHRAVPLDGLGVQQLSPEDSIIQSCVHLAVTHQMSRFAIRTLLDLHLARHKWTIDWRIVAERARAWRVSSATWLVLQSLADVFGDPDNQLHLTELAPSPFRQFALRQFVSARLLVEGLNLGGGPRKFLFLLLLVDRPADALLLVWRTLFPDRLWLTLRYDSPNASAWQVWQLRAKHIANIVISRQI